MVNFISEAQVEDSHRNVLYAKFRFASKIFTDMTDRAVITGTAKETLKIPIVRGPKRPRTHVDSNDGPKNT